MDSTSRYGVGALLVAVGAALSAVAFPEMPAEMVTHWDAGGTPDDTLPRTVALALLPALGAAVLALFAVAPRLDPLGENVAAFRATYEWTAVGVVALLTYVHALLVCWNAGYEVAPGRALVPALVGLSLGLAVVLERAEPNWFLGIRTPWTLSDDRVWERTHHRAGRLLMRLAPVGLVGLIVPTYAVLVAVAPLLLVTADALVFSYREYRRVGAA